MIDRIKTYNKINPVSFYAVVALIATTWLITWPILIQSLSISLAIIVVYVVLTLIFAIRLKKRKTRIMEGLKSADQNIIHNIATNTEFKKQDENDFKEMLSVVLDHYVLPENIPFYYIIGFDSLCNTTVLNDAGFTFTDLEKHGPYTCSVDNYHFHWWFTDKGILIDLSTIMDRGKDTPHGEDLNQLDKLTEFLMQFSDNPVKGLIYTLTTDLIIDQDQSQFIHKVQLLKTITQKIVSKNSCKLPYTMLIQNAQKIEGFTEFVSCYVQSGIAGPIGTQVTNQQVDDNILDLINQLNSLVPGMLYEKGNSYNSLLLVKFLDNLDLLRELISEVGRTVNAISQCLRFESIYFIGANDDKATKPANTSGINDLAEYYQQTNHFIFNSIFNNTLPPRANRRFSSFASLLLPVVLTIAGLTEIGYLFIRNYSQINHSKTNVEAIQLIGANKNHISAEKLLTILQKIRQPTSTNQGTPVLEGLHRLINFSVSQHLEHGSDKLYGTILSSLMSKNLSAYINDDLKNFLTLSTQQQLNFVQLIVDIKSPKWTNSSQIYRYFKSHIFKTTKPASSHEKNLRSHFMFYAKNIKSKDIVVNKPLLHRTLLSLTGKRLQDYLLQATYAKAKSEPAVFLFNLIDKEFARFIQQPQIFTIPFRYTREGYAQFETNLNIILKTYEKQLNSISLLGNNVKIDTDQLQQKIIGLHLSNHVAAWKNVFGPVKFIQFESRTDAAIVLGLLSRTKDITVELKLLAVKNLPLVKSPKAIAFTLFLKQIKDTPQRSALLKLLVRSINKSGNNLTSLKLLKKLKIISRRTWVGKTYLSVTTQQLTLLLRGNKRKDLINAWNKTIYTYCVKNFENRYPFKKNYNRTVNANHFRKYFGRKGMLDRFYRKKLKQYVVTKKRKLQWNKKGQLLEMDKRFLKQFEIARSIKRHWLRYGRIKFNFKVKPLFLDPKANRFKLTIGSTIIKYSHGVQQFKKITWVPGRYASSVHFTFFKPGGRTVSGTYPKNRWSWMQLIDRSIRTKKGVITFRRKGYKAQYQIGQVRSIRYKLNLVARYRCIKQ